MKPSKAKLRKIMAYVRKLHDKKNMSMQKAMKKAWRRYG